MRPLKTPTYLTTSQQIQPGAIVGYAHGSTELVAVVDGSKMVRDPIGILDPSLALRTCVGQRVLVYPLIRPVGRAPRIGEFPA